MEIWDILDGWGNKTGRTVVRGELLKEGEYHLAVHIWIMNDRNEFLIQKRAEHLSLMPGFWAVTGGSVIQGEDSKAAAIREVREELGIEIDINKFTKIGRIKRRDSFADVWLLKDNIALKDITMQKEEVSDIAWAKEDEIKEMINKGLFHNYGETYFNNIFLKVQGK